MATYSAVSETFGVTVDPPPPVFSNGESASDGLGQFNIDNATVLYNKEAANSLSANNGPNQLGFDAPIGVALDSVNHRFFVADSDNSRILVYNLDSTNSYSGGRVPAHVLGQTNFTSVGQVPVMASTMYHPAGLAYDSVNNRLFVSVPGNARVLVFNTSTITNGMAASYVLGQPNFTSDTHATTQSGMWFPTALAYDSGDQLLYVADGGNGVAGNDNNRVLVFNVAPGAITNGENASYVLGQTNFTSNTAGTTQSGLSLYTPNGLFYDPVLSRLYVSDTLNNRVLVFNTASLSNGMNASYVLGQPNFTSATARTTQSGMDWPVGLGYDPVHTLLYVAETRNSRVTVFTVASGAISNGENALYVLGQSSFSSSGTAATQSGLSHPGNAYYDSGNSRLYVSDVTNNRLLMFDTSGIANGEDASDGLGQFNIDNATVLFTKASVNNGPNQLGFNQPDDIALDNVNHNLYVSDCNNNRVLVYNLSTTNTFSTRTPAQVLGQPNFTTNTAGASQSTLSCPLGLAFDAVNNRLFVADSGNNRVMMFSTASITSGMSASNVLGQSSFTTGTAATTQSGLKTPAELALDSTKNLLYVSDTANNRVMVFSTGAIANGESASFELGQTAFTTNSAATTQSGLDNPQGLALDSADGLLYVADQLNNRVMVFKTASIADGESASYELGQPGGTAFSTNSAATTQAGLYEPLGLSYDALNHRLFVGDYDNNRVLVFNVAPATIANGETASSVLGQASFTTRTAATTQWTLSLPRNLFYDPGSGRLFVADSSNDRVMIFSVGI